MPTASTASEKSSGSTLFPLPTNQTTLRPSEIPLSKDFFITQDNKLKKKYEDMDAIRNKIDAPYLDFERSKRAAAVLAMTTLSGLIQSYPQYKNIADPEKQEAEKIREEATITQHIEIAERSISECLSITENVLIAHADLLKQNNCVDRKYWNNAVNAIAYAKSYRMVSGKLEKFLQLVLKFNQIVAISLDISSSITTEISNIEAADQKTRRTIQQLKTAMIRYRLLSNAHKPTHESALQESFAECDAALRQYEHIKCTHKVRALNFPRESHLSIIINVKKKFTHIIESMREEFNDLMRNDLMQNARKSSAVFSIINDPTKMRSLLDETTEFLKGIHLFSDCGGVHPEFDTRYQKPDADLLLQLQTQLAQYRALSSKAEFNDLMQRARASNAVLSIDDLATKMRSLLDEAAEFLNGIDLCPDFDGIRAEFDTRYQKPGADLLLQLQTQLEQYRALSSKAECETQLIKAECETKLHEMQKELAGLKENAATLSVVLQAGNLQEAQFALNLLADMLKNDFSSPDDLMQLTSLCLTTLFKLSAKITHFLSESVQIVPIAPDEFPAVNLLSGPQTPVSSPTAKPLTGNAQPPLLDQSNHGDDSSLGLTTSAVAEVLGGRNDAFPSTGGHLRKKLTPLNLAVIYPTEISLFGGTPKNALLVDDPLSPLGNVQEITLTI